ncbi:MAG: hypothetical protein KGL39_15135 [Patescibacteria group bacterium]|nr:hypothetical protein [Patescibacteria group bacterium]
MTDPTAVFQRIRAEEQRLWVPGVGEVDPRVTAAQRVVREYDERLELARHEITGDWVIFVKIGRDNIYPVIGIGPELPANAEDLRQRLWKADTTIHGDRVLREINEHNRRIQAESRTRALDADEACAEAFEWGFRREGVLSPKVFIPRDL